MSHRLPPCDHDECPPTRCLQRGSLAAAQGWTSNFYPTERTDLPENTAELLIALHREFYGGPKAHADAFRVLPRVVNALVKAGAIPPPSNNEGQTIPGQTSHE